MQVRCKCGNDTFFVEKTIQFNGNTDTLEISCTQCKEIYEYDVIGADEYG